MFISKLHLSRRTFLRGVGVSIALPFLESMVPAGTALAQTAAAAMALCSLPQHIVRTP